MNEAFVIEMVVPRKSRIERVVEDYGALDSEQMENAIEKIEKRLGSERKKVVIENYREGKLELVADMLLDYYDKGYQYSRDRFKREREKVIMPDGNAKTNAKILIEKVH
jgi:tRNA 2-selenouridine synthase